MTYTTLIDIDELRANLHAPDWVVFDCRFDLVAPSAGERAYRAGHIPGACYAHLDDHLSSPVTRRSGRHPLPEPSVLAAWLGGCGVQPTSQVIVYDDQGGAIAARLWWLLRWLGHTRVAVLDGGLTAWRSADFELSSDEPARVGAQHNQGRVR